jgi:DNA-cytosine methyltransferase
MLSQQHKIWVVDDNSGLRERRDGHYGSILKDEIAVRVHTVSDGCVLLKQKESYKVGTLGQNGKSELALKLIALSRLRSNAVVVADANYGSNNYFLMGLAERNKSFVVGLHQEVKVSPLLRTRNRVRIYPPIKVKECLTSARWKRIEISPPEKSGAGWGEAADLGLANIGNTENLRLFAYAAGGIAGSQRGLIIGASSLIDAPLQQLVEMLSWIRWLRPLTRRQIGSPPSPTATVKLEAQRAGLIELVHRSNISISSQQDERNASQLAESPSLNVLGRLTANQKVVRVAELFAGAGGLGLGFLLAAHQSTRYKIAFAGELDPSCVVSLQTNYARFATLEAEEGHQRTPEAVFACDLRLAESKQACEIAAHSAGGIDVLIGGPPCQGFSNSNRNNWRSDNPHNQLVNTFLEYVELLSPPVILLENVQGILWTPPNATTSDEASVADFVAARLERAGYLFFPKLLDAVWYGVPQYRSRFFLLGLHRTLGYTRADFGEWGPFPYPTHGPGTPHKYVTVREAIADLPSLENGSCKEISPYQSVSNGHVNTFLQLMRQAAGNTVSDHITSRHADYVIERYKAIPPGGNWESVKHLMTNYADIQRTHSNIYRRLEWDRPSITIGHYRKSMLIHPEQHRGLSLREASRLQSFPDWFRFESNTEKGNGGLTYKQQQLANAVCPLAAKAIAEFILKL